MENLDNLSLLNKKCISPELIKQKNIKNKAYIMKYSLILIIISLVLAVIGLIDYYKEWSQNNEILVLLYGINWGVLILNIIYFINTKQRSELFTDLN